MGEAKEWRDWRYIAKRIAMGAKRQEIMDYFSRTKCRYCATVGFGGCDECPLFDHDPETGGCSGGHYAIVHIWANTKFSLWPTRTEALKSARVIAEITGSD